MKEMKSMEKLKCKLRGRFKNEKKKEEKKLMNYKTKSHKLTL